MTLPNSVTSSVSHSITYQWGKAMERNIITMDGQGNIALPTDTGSIAMTEWELCELFGVIAPTVRAGIKALCKSGVLREYDIKRSINLPNKCSMEVYNLEAIIALAFRINSFGAEQVRRAVLERLYLRKEKTSIFFSLNITDTSSPKYFA